jgi:hypothetical protein
MEMSVNHKYERRGEITVVWRLLLQMLLNEYAVKFRYRALVVYYVVSLNSGNILTT